jgi:YD repeat-containing protein
MSSSILARCVSTATAGLLAALAAAPLAHAIERAQPPQLKAPERGSLAGALSGLAIGPGDVSRGGFTLAAPMSAPQERGPLLAPIFPSYNPDQGLSVWGMGWSTSLALTRMRVTGDLSWSLGSGGDELSGPFGRMVRSDSDGDFYPVGLAERMRAHVSGNTITIYNTDGTTWSFGGDGATVDGPQGTYAWQLRSVEDPLGYRTELGWSPMNATGNPRLDRITYGGLAGDPPPYQIALDYEPIAAVDSLGRVQPRFVDYRAGRAIALDQRVARVHVSTRHAQTGQLVERWAWELLYREEAHGAAFYLTSIEKIFASGERDPIQTYAYRLESDTQATVARREVPQLTALFARLGVTADVIQPNRAAVTDVDLDGNPDLEVGDARRTLINQVGSGTSDDPLHFEVTQLPDPAPLCTSATQLGCLERRCRPLPTTPGQQLPPRLLSELNPTDDTIYVIDFQYQSASTRTTATLCTREGVRLSVSALPGRWEPSAQVRFVDVNRDHLPDLVRVSSGHVEVVLAQPGATPWNPAHVQGSLLGKTGLPIVPDNSWISDANGDGLVDLTVQLGSALEVYYGLGGGHFTETARELAFVGRSGSVLPTLTPYQLIPADLDKDGLVDYFLTNASSGGGRFIGYFVNDGAKLVEAVVPALEHLPGQASQPVIATLDGSGNLAVTFTQDSKAFSVQLDEPGTGLLLGADDGKGTRVDLSYLRGPAVRGIRQRSALLASMDVTTSGYDTLTSKYSYGKPTMHSRGKFLVGFDAVTRDEGDVDGLPRTTSHDEFANGDDFGGLPTRQVVSEARSPEVERITETDYEDASYAGLLWKRVREQRSGFAGIGAAAGRSVSTKTYDTYTGLCPTRTTTVSALGTLVHESELTTPARFEGHLPCIDAQVSERGVHADPSLDFVQVQRATYSDAGQLETLEQLGDGLPWRVQTVHHDAAGRIVAVESAGHGQSRFGYQPGSGLVVRQTDADGVIHEVSAIDPVRDLMLALRTDRGGASATSYFRFDGLDRLERSWDDVSGASEAQPTERVRYTYASLNTPASYAIDTLVDADTSVVHHQVQLMSGAAEKLMTASLTDVGWVADGFVARSRATNATQTLRVKNLDASADPTRLDYASLLVGDTGAPELLDASTSSAFGYVPAARRRFHAEVERRSRAELHFEGGTLARRDYENDELVALTTLDSDGKRVLAWQDASGARWEYTYDVLGRLRQVRQPDGSRHTVSFDAYGRIARIWREGVASLSYDYVDLGGEQPTTTDLVAHRRYASAPASGVSVPLRASTMEYDAAGRLHQITHVDAAGGAARAFRFYYDGALPGDEARVTLRGLTSAVTGDGYEKRFVYRADGKVSEQRLVITGWRTLVSQTRYRADGTVTDETTSVFGPTEQLISRHVEHHDVDAYGRAVSTSIDGQLLATYTYGADGLVARARFESGETIELENDHLTREVVGLTQTSPAWTGASQYRLRHDRRGFLADEWFALGGEQLHRSSSYSARGFLEQSNDEVVQP